jgi:hypothetical protein
MRKVLIGFVTTFVLVVGSVMAGPPVSSVDPLLGQYFIIHKSLAADSTSGVSAAAAQISKISRQAVAVEPQAKTQLIALADAAAKLRAADLKSARNGFGELSDKMIGYLQAMKAKRNPPYRFFCSMVKKYWLQPDMETRNPYYGSSMLKCGELVKSERAAQQSTEPHQH